MSTILKALEKSQHSNAVVIEKSEGSGWKIFVAIALLLIAGLLGAVVFLLLKPSILNTIVMKDKPLVAEVKTLVVKEKPLVVELSVPQNDFIRPSEADKVTEIDFKTVPLPPEQPHKLVSSKPANKKIYAAVTHIKDKPADNVIKDKVISDNVTEQKLSLDGVPADLQQRFALAVQQESSADFNEFVKPDKDVVASDIASMPAQFQFKVPLMTYDSHVYSSKPKDRWIRINGRELRVGDHIGDIELVDILPNQSVFRLGSQSFTLESLRDWKG